VLIKIPDPWFDILARVVSVLVLIIRRRAEASYEEKYGVCCGKYVAGDVPPPRRIMTGVQSPGAKTGVCPGA
jgi:hypothetical protein